jgi:ferrochelatase
LRLRAVESYATHPAYLRALAATIEVERRERGEPERWLLSFHGIPKTQARRGDPYSGQCAATAQALAELARLPQGRWEWSFQSRFGPQPWLSPYTDRRLEQLGRERVGSLAVLCPGFAADCLETLEEIGVRGRESFQHSGGGELRLVSCLNAQPHWVAALAEIVRSSC